MPLSTEVEATYRVVTPCFCGGARQRPEFRPPSFKGVLRYWWRALARAQYEDLATIQRAEARLFGSADGGQSRVRMWLSARPNTTVESAKKVLGPTPGARYLGYGMADSDRSCLLAPFTVTIGLHYRPPRPGEPSEGAPQSLLDALTVVGLLGGIGAKSRKGFGSMMLTGLRVDGRQVWSPPGTIAELAERIASVAQEAGSFGDYPEFTALSGHSRFLLIDGGQTSPLRLVDRIGEEYKTHLRQVGEADDLLRAGFGLPRHGRPSQNDLTPAASDLDRRASPLFIHIHECNGRSVAVLSLLPATFLPEGRDGVRTGRGRSRAAVASELCGPVHELFARLSDGCCGDAWEVPR